MPAGQTQEAAPSSIPNRMKSDSLTNRIAKLIEQLGDPNFSNRLGAQSELERIGILALDQLHAASFHPDPQIAATARFIVQSNQFSWEWDTDPVQVKQILTDYANAHISEKSVCIDQLYRLEHDQGFGALCRLVRYETQSGLAKRAALLLMRSKPILDQTIQERRASLLDHITGGQSQASRWVLKYASNETEIDLQWWLNVIDQETKLLDSQSNETSFELVTDLRKFVMEQIASNPQLRNQALDMGRALLQLGQNIGKSLPSMDTLSGSRVVRASEFAQWALKFKFPELVQEQHAILSLTTVTRESMFGYFLAESYKMQGKEDVANQIANRTLRQTPVNEKGELRVATDNEKEDPIRKGLDFVLERRSFSDITRRQYIAQQLTERGLFAWAEAEFRLALSLDGDTKKPETLDLTQMVSLDVMQQYAIMLHSLGRHNEAAQTLEPFMSRFKNEPMFQRQMSEWSTITESIQSYYYLFLGDQASEANDTETAKSNYWQSIEISPENVDALIGLYRLQLPESETTKRRTKLKEIVNGMRSEIRQVEEQLKFSTNQSLASLTTLLSSKCNSLAWVVANTEGSKEEALFLSRKACGLRPEDAELIDTLAHCYAALGRFEDALEQQRRAVSLKPHHPVLRKALAKFEKLYEDSKKAN
jgi:tetratricopeptide (TPR) repeat protein